MRTGKVKDWKETLSRRKIKPLGQFTLSLGMRTTRSTDIRNKCPSLVRNAMVSAKRELMRGRRRNTAGEEM